jgi:single-strand DNA-binding protein
MLIGRLAKEAEIVNFEGGKRVINITMAVARGFKNTNGEIETDFFKISFWDFMVDYVLENLKVGMFISVKGRIQTTPNTLANGYILQTPTLIGEKIVIFPERSHLNQEEENEDL